MRTICDVCEGAPALLFCAADEAALCASCDDKVHKCNKLASRHVRVRLAEPSAVRNCDICEKSPAFFFCQIDGSKLCLQCDVIVHVGGKQTHERYLLFKQRVEFAGDYLALQNTEHDYNREQNGLPHQNPVYASMKEKTDDHRVPSLAVPQYNSNPDKHDSAKIDLNAIPHYHVGCKAILQTPARSCG